MSYLVAHLAKRHHVTLLTLEGLGVPSFYPLPDSLQQIRIDKLGGGGIRRLFRILSRPLRVRREVRTSTPDVVLSFMDTMNVTALVSCLGLGVPVVVSERNDPALHRIGRFKEILRDHVYPLARFVVAQTPRVARYFEQPWLQPKLRIIPNPVPAASLFARPDEPNAEGRMRVIAIGRFEAHKGLDRLIDAFASIAQDWPNWDLLIIGDGPKRATLEVLVQRHGMDERIQMPGKITDINRELALSHLMAFPSQFEGFPNALAEALAAGLPAIGHRGVSGVEDLIVDGKTGMLVELDRGTAALAAALSALMRDGRQRRELGEAAQKYVAQWGPSRILVLWEGVLIEAARKSGGLSPREGGAPIPDRNCS